MKTKRIFSNICQLSVLATELYSFHSAGEIHKHDVVKLLEEYKQTENKFFIYKDLPQSYSDELYKNLKQYGSNKLLRLSKKLSPPYTWGDIVSISGMLDFLPSSQHKYDFVSLFARIGFTVWSYIPKDFNKELENKYKKPIEQIIKDTSADAIYDIQKRNSKLKTIAAKWYPVLKYVLGLNDTLEEMSVRFGTDRRMKFKNMFERGYINQLSTHAKSPTDILFKDAFVNESFIGSYFASRNNPTCVGINETKMYAIHHTQLIRHKIPETVTVYTPPDVTIEDCQRVLSQCINYNNVPFVNLVAPQLLMDTQIQTIIDSILPDNLNKITDTSIVQY